MPFANGRRFLIIAAAFAMTGCGGNTLGQLGEVLGSMGGQPQQGGAAQQGQVAVEIQGVDTRQQMLQVATQDGQSGSVRYDRNTVVVYQNQQHPITALERGDLAILHLQQVQGGGQYVSRVDVQQSVQDRTGTSGSTTGNIVQLAGRVAQINHDAGTFVLQTQNGNLTVSLPYNAPQATADYFHRLRNGQNVRLEATPISNTTAQIHRFL